MNLTNIELFRSDDLQVYLNARIEGIIPVQLEPRYIYAYGYFESILMIHLEEVVEYVISLDVRLTNTSRGRKHRWTRLLDKKPISPDRLPKVNLDDWAVEDAFAVLAQFLPTNDILVREV